jgi:benzaldehyde dehydrogenase (NAD)
VVVVPHGADGDAFVAAATSHFAAASPMVLFSQGGLDHLTHGVATLRGAGAQLLAGGSYEGLFYRPTVLSGVKPGMRCVDEEVFGPVLNLMTFRSDDEAVELANNHAGGLAAAVISRSVGRATALAQRLRAGMVHVNDQTVNDDATNPFGGPGAAGNGNAHGGPADWEAFTTWQWLTVQDTPPAYPF